MQLPAVDITAVYPEFIVALAALAVLVADLLSKKELRGKLTAISIAGLAFAFFITLLMLIWDRKGTAFSGMVAVDPFAQFFKMIFVLSAAFSILMSPRYLRLFHINAAEYYELILFSTVGMMVMVAANDLITIYIGLELMSISIYLMAGFQRESPRSSEASIKYFLLGSFASAVLLYGMSFFYGITGTTNLMGIQRYLDFTQNMLNSRLITLSLVLMTVGFGFKIAAVPFHMWTPDVYEGAPTPLTAFMSVGPKVAGFAVILRVYMTTFDTLIPDWTVLFWVLSVLTMIVGNVVAVAQLNIKRMLAYSSIAHAGYLLIGVVAAGSATELARTSSDPKLAALMESLKPESMMSVLVYLFAYMFMNLGAFAIVISLAKADNPCESLSDYAGLGKRKPITALMMAILLLSLTGIPPTFGFIGKLYIFKAAILANHWPLAIIGVLTSVVAAYYYIRVIVYMYMREPEGALILEGDRASSTLYTAIAATVFTLLFGIVPGAIIGMARYTIERMLA
ncbi:MAG: NADH-quinone oxidoreductase subunit N [Candidatus Abyssubacteria bacterium]